MSDSLLCPLFRASSPSQLAPRLALPATAGPRHRDCRGCLARTEHRRSRHCFCFFCCPLAPIAAITRRARHDVCLARPLTESPCWPRLPALAAPGAVRASPPPKSVVWRVCRVELSRLGIFRLCRAQCRPFVSTISGVPPLAVPVCAGTPLTTVPLVHRLTPELAAECERVINKTLPSCVAFHKPSFIQKLKNGTLEGSIVNGLLACAAR